jgi:regulator of RNase E activity RraA
VRAIATACEIDVFGMVVHSGDLIHADRHGAVVIPPEVARKVADAAVLCGRREEPILEVARSPDFSLDKLAAAMAEAAEIH